MLFQRPWTGSILLTLLFSACSSEAEEQVSGVSAEPEVALSDLVAAERNDGMAPASPHLIELSPKGLSLEGERFMALENKQFEKSSGAAIPLLRQRLSTTRERGGAVLRVHAQASYGSLVRVLATLEELGVSPVVFEVRSGLSGSTGYIPLRSFQTVPESAEPVAFGERSQRSWDEVLERWEEMSQQCQGRGSVSCPSRGESLPEGGLAELELFSQQDAMRVTFRRFGAPEPEAPKGKKKPKAEDGPKPPVEFEMMWRRSAAHVDGSPIGLAMRPLCGATRCGAVVRGHRSEAAGNTLRLIASAFPNGAPAAELRFVVPEGI